MKMRSNVNYISNVYLLEKEFKEDRIFQSKIRGRDNLKAMLTVLSGQGWIKGAVSVDEYTHLLTGLQQQEWELGMPCACLDDKTEVVWGVVRKDNRKVIECRCLKVSCRNFKNCRPGYSGTGSAQTAAVEKPAPESEPALPQPLFLPQNDVASADNTDTIDIVFEEEYSLDDYVPPAINETGMQNAGPAADSQEAVIKSMPEERLLVLAGPGTGKTYCLIEKLKHMIVDTCSIDAEDILLLCFTRAAVREIKTRLREEAGKADAVDDISRIDIRTFDSFATLLLSEAGVNFEGCDYDTRIEKAIQVIKDEPEIIENMKHFMVDEIQDLVGVRARFVRTILRHSPEDSGFTLLGDHLQGIYDYQVKNQPGEINADDLLKWARATYGDSLQEHTLTGNIRQTGRLAEYTGGLRVMLESSQNNSQGRFFSALKNLPVRGADYNFPAPAVDDGRTAILCRNNGEVLSLSAQMRKRNISHNVKRRYNTPLLPEWLGVLAYSDSDRVTAEGIDDLLGKYARSRPAYQPERLYRSLQYITEEEGRFLSISRLAPLLAAGNRLQDELYEDSSASTLVSTIHQSKGREYDTVLYYYNRNNQPADSDYDEAKVAYVAITRAKQRLQLLKPGKSNGWLQPVAPGSERWGRFVYEGGRKKIKVYEVGREGDLDELSFAATENGSDIQDYINAYVNTGDSVELILDNDLYRITHEGRVIGSMTTGFTGQLIYDLKKIYGRRMEYMPERMDDIYVNRKYTVIKRPETLGSNIHKQYSKGIWTGVSIIGLGKVRWNLE